MGPFCPVCGGPSAASARSRLAELAERRVAYLAYAWGCLTCGHLWEDADLERANCVAMACALPARSSVLLG